MSSCKLAIRRAVLELLKARDDRAQGRWFANLRRGISDADLPGGVIFTEDQTNEQTVESPEREFKRTVRLVVQFALALNPRSRDDGQDVLDLWTSEIEHLLLDDDTLGGVCESIRPVRSEYGFVEDGERPIAAQSLEFEVDYREEFPGEVALPDFAGVDVHTIGPPDSDDSIEAET